MCLNQRSGHSHAFEHCIIFSKHLPSSGGSNSCLSFPSLCLSVAPLVVPEVLLETASGTHKPTGTTQPQIAKQPWIWKTRSRPSRPRPAAASLGRVPRPPLAAAAADQGVHPPNPRAAAAAPDVPRTTRMPMVCSWAFPPAAAAAEVVPSPRT